MDKTALQRANRVNDLRAGLQKMNPDELAELAKTSGAALEGDETREEAEFAIAEATVANEDAAAALAAAEQVQADKKAEREAFYATKEGKRQRAIDEQTARDDAVRRVNTDFARALPVSARMQGTHQPAPDAAGDHAVPDGRYRVSGSQWVMSFESGKWISADMAHARTEPDWIEIPDVAGASVSVPARGGKSI